MLLIMDNALKKTTFCDFIEQFGIIVDTLPAFNVASKGRSAVRWFLLLAPFVFRLLNTICNNIND